MHDPMTVAFDLKRPWPQVARAGSVERRAFGRFYWPTLVTIWHVDPERDGTDDSCGWFPRAHHGDPEVLRRIERAFATEWSGSKASWFTEEDETPQLATSSIVLDMFLRAAQQVYTDRLFDRHGWRGATRFCRRHLFDILRFAGNGTDSFHTFIESTFGRDEEYWSHHPPGARREQRIADAAAIVYGWMLRTNRPWYRHPRWHVWHWKIQVHALQSLKRWAFSRCAGCGRRFTWGYAPTSFLWSGTGPRWFRGETGVYHTSCASRTSVSAQIEPDREWPRG